MSYVEQIFMMIQKLRNTLSDASRYLKIQNGYFVRHYYVSFIPGLHLRFTENATKSVLFVTDDLTSPFRYRCLHLSDCIRHNYNARITFIHSSSPKVRDNINIHDNIIFFRCQDTNENIALFDYAKACGKNSIYSTDDLIFDPSFIRYFKGLSNHTPEEQEIYRKGIGKVLISKTDKALVSTGFLFNVAKKFNNNVFVINNFLGSELLSLSEKAYRVREKKSGNKTITIGYFSGTKTHDVDFLVVSDILLQLLEENENLILNISGHLELPESYLKYQDRINRRPFMHWRDFINNLASVDINIVPLEQDNPFCEAKSEIKYIEAGILGIPTVATQNSTYSNAIQSGKNGFLANDPTEWHSALTKLITSDTLIDSMGKLAREDVLDRYTYKSNLKQILDRLLV